MCPKVVAKDLNYDMQAEYQATIALLQEAACFSHEAVKLLLHGTAELFFFPPGVSESIDFTSVKQTILSTQYSVLFEY